MKTERIVMLILKDYFRKNSKKTWGKNELVKELDDLEERICNQFKDEEELEE